VSIERQAGVIVSGPEIISRGFVYVRESEELIEDSKRVLNGVLKNCSGHELREWNALKTKLRDTLSEYIYEKTKRSPMILPIIMEI
jgi:ribonuclease J